MSASPTTPEAWRVDLRWRHEAAGALAAALAGEEGETDVAEGVLQHARTAATAVMLRAKFQGAMRGLVAAETSLAALDEGASGRAGSD